MFDESTWAGIPRRFWQATVRSLAFKLISASGAEAHVALVVPRTTYPYKLFAILKDVSKAPAVSAYKRCLYDPWTASFVSSYADLAGDTALCDLEAAADAFMECISSLEARHASNRREIFRNSAWPTCGATPRALLKRVFMPPSCLPTFMAA